MSKNTAMALRLTSQANQSAVAHQSALAQQSAVAMDNARQARAREIRADDRMWAKQLRARHGDLISRYAQRRLGSLDQADQVTQAVFAHAAANRSQITEPALPWLIAAARARCAQYRQRPTRPVARRP